MRAIYFLSELEDRDRGIDYFETILHYVFSAGKSLTEVDVHQIIQEVEVNYPKGSDLAMTMADRWREEGMVQGMERGKEIGRVEALSKTVFTLLTEKFGKVPQDIQDGISKQSAIELEILLSNIFRYESVDDVRKYL